MSTIANGRGCPRSSCPSGWVSSRQSVSKWERDESLPEADKLPLLAKTLGVSLDALLSGEEEAPSQPAGPTPAKGGAVGKLAWLFRRWGLGGRLGAGRLRPPSPLGWACWLASPHGADVPAFGAVAASRRAGARGRLWGSKSSPWPSWWWAGWPLLGESSRRAVLYRRRPKGKPVRLFC